MNQKKTEHVKTFALSEIQVLRNRRHQPISNASVQLVNHTDWLFFLELKITSKKGTDRQVKKCILFPKGRITVS